MARPKKTGLDYFPFDTDFFDDEAMVCIAGEFGIKGEITAVKLLCAVYRNGYFILWDEKLKMKMLRSLPGISPELLDQILNRLVKWGFFDETLFGSVKVLTSRKIQERYFGAVRRRHTAGGLPYLLVDVKAGPTLEKEIETLKSDHAWLETLQLLHHTDESGLLALLDEFALHCRAGDMSHTGQSELKQHFNNWLYRTTKKGIENGIYKQRTDNRRGNLEVTATCAEDYKTTF